MSNILNKVDKSLAPVPQRNGAPSVSVAKRTKFDWSQGGKPGCFREVKKSDLNIDGRYQREQVSDGKVSEIARNWDWVLLGVIMVVEREDGSLWVFDGGHRTRASFYRDDVTTLPCMVYRVGDLSNEARAFLGKNLMISNVSSVAKHRAAVVASDDTALATQCLLDEFGLTVTLNATNATHIKCINTLQKMVESDHTLARRCLAFCLQRTDGSPVSAVCLRGLFCLCRHFAGECDVLAVHGEKLARHSQKEIEIRARQVKAEFGVGGDVIEAKALLSLINKGCRNKLVW